MRNTSIAATMPLLLALGLLVACGDSDEDPAADTSSDTAADTGGGEVGQDADDASELGDDGAIDPDAEDAATDGDDADSHTDADVAPDTDAAIPEDGDGGDDEDVVEVTLACGGVDADNSGGPFIVGGLVGPRTLVFDAVAEGAPWDDGAEVSVLLEDGDVLTVDGVAMSEPVQRTDARIAPAEAIWCADGFEYALSNVDSASFNEINVFDLSRTGSDGLSLFVGQLRSGAPDGLTLVTPYVGEYTVTEIWAGTHERGTLSIAADGTIDFDDGAIVGADSATAEFDRIGCCGRVQVDYEASADNGWTTTINLYLERDGDGHVLRDVERTFRGNDGEGFGFTDVSVRVPIAFPEPTGTLPGGTPRLISGTVDGTTVSTEVVSPSVGFVDAEFTLVGEAPDGDPDAGLALWTLTAPAQVGDFMCEGGGAGEGASLSWRTRGAPPFGEGANTGGCRVFVDSITVEDGALVAVEGRFVAVLRNSFRVLVGVVDDGVFRFTAPE